jgi:UvrD-like helicase C-terminal domain/AAA domain
MDANRDFHRQDQSFPVRTVTLVAFTGPAGVGKTHRLMDATGDALAAAPLQDGQRVLAMTFMHGSRRRLDDRLRGVRGLRSCYVCMTVDRFAWELCTRWRSLRRYEGMADPREDQYDATCNTAGALMENDQVRTWVARSYPYVVVDEAQDLKPQRLRIFRALEPDVSMLIAADEFQCLIPELRPNPAIAWLNDRSQPVALNVQQRTNQAVLIATAHAIREGQNVIAGGNLTIMAAPGRQPFNLAATCVANAIAWNGGNDIALITPSKAGGFASTVVSRVGSGPLGQQQNGPYHIQWEQSDEDAAGQEVANLNLPDNGDVNATLAALGAADAHPALHMCRDWVLRNRSLTGQTVFQPALVREQLVACFRRYRRFARSDSVRIKAMTVHQAKNREFEGVIVLWPYTVAGSAEQQRRLLYNAVTRAKRWCAVIVQNQSMLHQPPFRAAGATE